MSLTAVAGVVTLPVSMRLRLPSVIALTALAVLVLAPIGSLAAAGIDWGECCCGHDAEDCPSCRDRDRGGDDNPAPSLRTCGPDGELVGVAALPRVIVPELPVLVPPRAASTIPAPLPSPSPPPTAEIETPPPRASL